MAKMQVSYWFWSLFFILGAMFFSFLATLNIVAIIACLILGDLWSVVIYGVATGLCFVVVVKFIDGFSRVFKC